MSVKSRFSPSVSDASAPQRSIWNRLEKPLTGLIFTLSLMLLTEGLPSLKAQGVEVPVNLVKEQMPNVVEASRTQQQSLLDGTYVYGQSTEAEQIGSTYLVFEVSDSRIVGAFYMPQSSFDCFQGELEANQLALTITDSYDQSHYSHTVGLERNADVAGTSAAPIASFNLTGYHSINTVSDNDERILATCKALNQ